MTDYDIFISHATPDDPAADKVYDALTANGYSVFLDHKALPPGVEWEKDVQEAMIRAKAGVILLSRESLNRLNCNGERLYFFSKYQRKEVRVFVALLENLTPDEIPFSVNAIQYVNLSSDFDGQLTQLVSAIQDKITLTALESKELPPEAPKSTLADARLLKSPDDLGENESPRTLIGREDDLAKILALLEAGQRTVIQAHGGAGKTALAGKLTEDWLRTKSPVLWMRAGSADADGMFEAVGHAFGQDQAMAKAQGEDKVHLTRELLKAVSLVVIDDVWNAPGIARFANAVPRNCPLLVTSRLRLDALDALYVLDDLSDAAALDLLVFHGGKWDDPDAPKLIDTLGNLAFALEIAGKTLKRTGDTAAQLLQKMKDSPHELRLNSAEAGRENVAALIDASLKTLDEFTRKVFLAFGAFFDPQVTVELMAGYTASNVSSEQIAQTRENTSWMLSWSDEEIRDLLLQSNQAQPDITGTNDALSHLHDSGLAQHITEFDRLPPEHPSAPTYRIHDLSYAYAASQMSDDERKLALRVCLSYTRLYNEPGWEAFTALLPVLDGLLNAAQWAFAYEEWQITEEFAWNLVVGSKILDYLGYAGRALTLLDNAVIATKARSDPQAQGVWFGELGSTYFQLAQYPRAIEYYERALTISRAIADKQGESSDLGNLGNVYLSLGEYHRAIGYYEQALSIRRVIGDKHGESGDLGNLGIVYSNLGEYLRAIEYFGQALAISRAIGNKRGEGHWLGNLGNAYYTHLGDYPHAIEYFGQALAISRSITDKHNEGRWLGNLGMAYYTHLGDYPHAIEYFEQALIIHRQIGDRQGEASALNNLGMVYEALEDYPRAIVYFQQARELFEAMGLAHMMERMDQNIANVQAKMQSGSSDE